MTSPLRAQWPNTTVRESFVELGQNSYYGLTGAGGAGQSELGRTPRSSQ